MMLYVLSSSLHVYIYVCVFDFGYQYAFLIRASLSVE